jgi:hypothetical protein
VKWLDRIEAVAEPFQGYQMVQAYRYAQAADDPGEPVSAIRVRALMIPLGIPDFMTGLAWSILARLLSQGKHGPVPAASLVWR